jgi:hypothetical protein
MRIYPYIHNAEELGIAILGSRFVDVVPHEFTVDRAEYGRALARLEGGIFSSKGYIVPNKDEDTDFGA